MIKSLLAKATSPSSLPPGGFFYSHICRLHIWAISPEKKQSTIFAIPGMPAGAPGTDLASMPQPPYMGINKSKRRTY